MALSDLFAPDSNYTEMINEKVRSIITLNPKYFEGKMRFKGISEDQRFYLENGTSSYTSCNMKLPYASGIRTFPVPLPAIPNRQDSSEAAVRHLVTEFGSRLKNVSLLATEDTVKNSIRENYGDLVSPALLGKWHNDVNQAPGRVTSSPWPERMT